MVIVVGSSKVSGCVSFGTHNGIFHCDEVVGIAILELMAFGTDVCVVRTRDPEELKTLDVVIDVGGGKFDHHMAGFNRCRPTGEKYASAGLVWKAFGKQVILNIAKELEVIIDDEDVDRIIEEIDREVIIPVDMEDNGEGTESHVFSFVPKFLPTWMEEPDYDEAFYMIETIASMIFEEIVKEKIVKVVTQSELQRRFENIENGILEIPAQTMPWVEEVVRYNEAHGNAVKFVIFPYPGGGWAAQSVPPAMDRKFEQLVPFPKEWAGGNEETLPAISGIHDATFCHNGRFFARAKTRESVVEMCRIAME